MRAERKERIICQDIVKALCDGRNVDILQAGMAGEYASPDCLAALDDNCYIFTNLHIPHEGKESETDIVVSPAGITIVEVKNHKGVIRGDSDCRKCRTSEAGVSFGYGNDTGM